MEAETWADPRGSGTKSLIGLDISKLMLYLKEKRPDVFVRLVRIKTIQGQRRGVL